MYVTVVKPPSAFSSEEIDDFVSFVLSGGEVTANKLREHVVRAEYIAFLRRDNCLCGVAGLKRPRPSYRTKVQAHSGFNLPDEAFAYELGWVFIHLSARGDKLSLPLCQPVVKAAGSSGVFATSKANNMGMHTTLGKLGFERAGSEWQSTQREDTLVLFVRSAANC